MKLLEFAKSHLELLERRALGSTMMLVWKYDEIDWEPASVELESLSGRDYLDTRKKITIDEDFVVRDYHVNKKYGLAKFGEVGSMVVNEDLTILDENGELYRDYYREKKMATGEKKQIKIKKQGVKTMVDVLEKAESKWE